MPGAPLLQVTPRGLHCAAGDFYIDPSRGVDFAVITHAHSDHARRGSENYLCADACEGVLRERLGPRTQIQTLRYGEAVTRNGVRISLHPAGHILGSAQVRVEHRGEVWVVSGDYKVEPEPTCASFEPVRCHVFITECTFGLPVYRWRPQAKVFSEINAWWRANQAAGRTSVMEAYSLGKAQRILAGIDASVGPVFAHDSIVKMLPHYAVAGVKLPEVMRAESCAASDHRSGALVLAPAGSNQTPWMRAFGETSRAFASGWMQLRSARRQQSPDRGFTLSDHADWDGLIAAVHATGATRVLATHGHTAPLVRWLCEHGLEAAALGSGHASSNDEEPAGE